MIPSIPMSREEFERNARWFDEEIRLDKMRRAYEHGFVR